VFETPVLKADRKARRRIKALCLNKKNALARRAAEGKGGEEYRGNN